MFLPLHRSHEELSFGWIDIHGTPHKSGSCRGIDVFAVLGGWGVVASGGVLLRAEQVPVREVQYGFFDGID